MKICKESRPPPDPQNHLPAKVLRESLQTCKSLVKSGLTCSQRGHPIGYRRALRATILVKALASSMSTILVIDDDESLRDTIGIMLEQEGFSPILAADGKLGYERALSVKPDLMIVDLRLPGIGASAICKQVRAAGLKTPIIVLSAVGEDGDKGLLLEIGADDYVVKPFGARELLARIRAVLRRTSPEARKVAQFGIVAVDFERRIVTRRGEALKGRPAQYNLLSYFLENPAPPLTPHMILKSCG